MENAWLIAGLGNPGQDLSRTRHNVGFMILERLAKDWQTPWKQEPKFKARLAKLERKGNRLFLCQPMTYMNASGESVGLLSGYYQVPREQGLVVVDDADLSLGELRMRPKGSSGGHRGLESVEAHLGSREFPRLRVGIGRGREGNREIVGHVLAPFKASEKGLIEDVIETACRQIEMWLDEGIHQAMNRYNGLVNR